MNNKESEGFFGDSISPNNRWAIVFDDNGKTGYMYLYCLTEDGDIDRIVDHLWIYNQIDPPIENCKNVFIIWSEDSTRAGLIVDGECWGIFDLSSKRKMYAPRKENEIITIDRHFWDNGLSENDGDPLRLE